MPLPDIQRKMIEEKLGKFCEERVPPHLRNELRIIYKVRGEKVTIIEQRPNYYSQGNSWIEIPVAQVRYDKQDSNWTLFYADSNGRWHEYDDLEPQTNLDPLLQDIKEDPTGIFWG